MFKKDRNKRKRQIHLYKSGKILTKIIKYFMIKARVSVQERTIKKKARTDLKANAGAEGATISTSKHLFPITLRQI